MITVEDDGTLDNVKGLRVGDKRNFETLCKAFKDGQVALLDVRRKSDGAKVAAVVSVVYNHKTRDYSFTPFAIMVEGNPFELFDPPSTEDELYDGATKETL